MVNKVILVGRLGKDPELRTLENGTPVTKFSVATSEVYRNKTSGEWVENTDWHDIICWRNLAERAEKQLNKGSLVYIEGKLKHRKYQDKDNNTKYITEVVADIFRSMESKKDANADAGGYFPTAQPASEPKINPVQTTSPEIKAEIDNADDDLPF